MSKSSKQLPKCLKWADTSAILINIMLSSVSLRLYCYHFLLLRNMNHVPDKYKLTVTVYNNLVSIQCNLTAQVESV
jgi:hypothetical protein